MHPDADRMSTFMEGSATAQEREEMLAHLAECGECRRVVFLMQEAEQPRLPHAETANARGWMGRWLMPAGLAGAALACGLATLVYVRTHRGTGEMVGQNAQVHSPAPVAPDLSKSEAPAGTGGQETAPKPENRASKRARGAGEAAQAAGGSGGAASGVSGVSVGNGECEQDGAGRWRYCKFERASGGSTSTSATAWAGSCGDEAGADSGDECAGVAELRGCERDFGAADRARPRTGRRNVGGERARDGPHGGSGCGGNSDAARPGGKNAADDQQRGWIFHIDRSLAGALRVERHGPRISSVPAGNRP